VIFLTGHFAGHVRNTVEIFKDIFRTVPQVRIPLGPPVRSLSGWASHFVAKAATPKPIGRRRAALHASYGPAGHPAIISGKIAARPTRFSLPTKISKTTPCKVTGGSLAWMLYSRKHFDTSGKSAAPFYHRTICKTADGAAHRNYGDLNPFGVSQSFI
jgi:hypothetical protein